MVSFVTNYCENLGGVGVIALLFWDKDFLKCHFSRHYIKVELRI